MGSNSGPECTGTAMFRIFGCAASMAVLLLGASLCAGSDAPEQGERMATCTNLVSGTSWQIRINFEKNLVDANPARISATKISWHDARDGGNYTLERTSGNLTVIVASSTGGYFLHDHCRLEQ
jgi:hypothetical protein